MKADTVAQIKLEGSVLFSTVEQQWKTLEAAMRKAAVDYTLDFSAVERVDSCALSLCLCARRLGQKMGVEVNVVNASEEMRSIADLVGLDHALLDSRH